MELSERAIQTFESEGFVKVYEHQDPAGTLYKEHSHQGKVSIFVTDGSVTLDFSGEKKEIVAPKRFDIPANTPHSVVVGTDGWIVIIGEEIEGDS
ncbi:hypothetical protein H6804_00020 [Candidatus Nomurabacteria bacterium]|nr:hypothetical protein [Candidatus Kaiserbacteria bacterium]MCB9815479.1 hypothetical protein [Candidatus Nomurabacteria bacterium]MCB9826651.1 hypothetical protein [Candidatus Nomurabacteria bacterium]